MPAKPLTPEQLEDAARLKAIFERAKETNPSVTQESVAEACGWKTQGTVSQYMNGKIPLNLSALFKFCDAFGVLPEDISPSLASQQVIPPEMKAIAMFKIAKRARDGITHDLESLHKDGRDVYPIGKGRLVPVIGSGNGGHLPERIWDDQGFAVGDSDEFSEIATSDNHAFIVRVRGDSMYPKYSPGEYALVEPGTVPDVGDDVLVRLVSGETLIKTLAARSADGIRLSSYNNSEVRFYANDEVSWIYWVPFPIPSKKIKSRV